MFLLTKASAHVKETIDLSPLGVIERISLMLDREGLLAFFSDSYFLLLVASNIPQLAVDLS